MDSAVSSFDELRDRFGTIVNTAEKDAAKQFPMMPFGRFETVVVGWSEGNGRPEANGAFRGLFGKLPDRPRQIKCWNFYPWDAQERRPEPTGDVDADAIAVMEIQRGLKMRATDGPGIETSGAGGFIQRTSVTREGISIKVLKRWPEDVIGKPTILTDAVRVDVGRKRETIF